MKHEKKAEKVLKVTRTWERLGSGLFGNRVRKKVTWDCKNYAFSGHNTFSSTTRDEFGIPASGEVGRGTLGDFTTLERKRKDLSSLEPRKCARLDETMPSLITRL